MALQWQLKVFVAAETGCSFAREKQVSGGILHFLRLGTLTICNIAASPSVKVHWTFPKCFASNLDIHICTKNRDLFPTLLTLCFGFKSANPCRNLSRSDCTSMFDIERHAL